MKLAVRVALAFTLLISTVGTQSWAQVSAAPQRDVVSLEQAIRTADANYPRVRASVEQQIAAQGGIAVAKAAYLPRLDLLWQTNRATANNLYGLLLPQSVVPSISGPVIASDNARSAWSSAGGALLSWQPFDFGARHANVEIARQSAFAAAAGTALTRLQVEQTTAAAYFDLGTAQQLALVAQASVERWQIFDKAIHVWVDNQLRAGADAAQADAELAQARTQLIQANTGVEVRRSVLAALLNVQGKIEVDAAPFLSRPPAQELLDTAIEEHPALVQQSAQVRQQRERLTALSRSYVPQFNVLGSISGRGAGTALNGIFPGGANGLAPDTLNWALGLQVAFPAFDLFSLHAQKKVQEATVRAQQANYDEALDDLSAQVRQAKAQFDGAQQVATNTPIELTAARQSETQQRARFQAGLATVIDVAAAESLLSQAEGDDAVAKLNVWRALAALAASRGDLKPFLVLLEHKP